MADRIIFGHDIGEVSSEEDMVRNKRARQRRELVGREHHRVYVDALEIRGWRLRQGAMAVGACTPGMIDATGIGAEISAAMHREDFEPRMPLENAIKDQIVQSDSGLQRI